MQPGDGGMNLYDGRMETEQPKARSMLAASDRARLMEELRGRPWWKRLLARLMRR